MNGELATGTLTAISRAPVSSSSLSRSGSQT